MLSILSNVNTDYILKLLAKDYDTVPPVGYGNMWGQLLDKNSALNKYEPDQIVFIVDIEQLLDSYSYYQEAKGIIDEWFRTFDSIVVAGREYLVSDTSFRSELFGDNDSIILEKIEFYWLEALMSRVESHNNIHVLKISKAIYEIGKDRFFSSKLWYMGKIPYSNEGTTKIAYEVKTVIELINKTTSKVLILDLDNTLWGGILGEKGVEGIELSDDHIGAVYKRVQQLIKQMKHTGVLLAICSKNNESDVQEVWEKHPYMILRPEDFVSVKINWTDKSDNITEMAKELNLGIESFVFIDDMPNERENVTSRLPGVIVPGFTESIEQYPEFITGIYNKFFKRCKSTEEDSAKTQQYADNTKRAEAAKGLSYEEFLVSLKLRVDRVDLDEPRLERVVQLIGKTNQFNLTTRRYSRQEIDRLLNDNYRIYAYNIADKFGDYGLVAVAIVDCNRFYVDTFLMSCRVMGKNVENYIMDDIENDLLRTGAYSLTAEYIKTAKNVPVMNFYDGLGYEVVEVTDDFTRYKIDLRNRPIRKYWVTKNLEEMK